MAKTNLQRGVGLGVGLGRLGGRLPQLGVGLGACLGRPGGRLALLCDEAKNGDLGRKTARKTPNRRGNQRNLAMRTQREIDQQV